MTDVVLHFQTGVDTILAAKALKDGGIKALLSTSMRGDSSNLCIILSADMHAAATSLLEDAGLSAKIAA